MSLGEEHQGVPHPTHPQSDLGRDGRARMESLKPGESLDLGNGRVPRTDLCEPLPGHGPGDPDPTVDSEKDVHATVQTDEVLGKPWDQ